MVSASISEIYDLSTTVGQGTVLKIHTPTGNNVRRHLLGYFLQYKKFRYVGAKVTLVPASTLPADPLQLSYAAGEPTIDPRDMVNPILWRHYHGEAMLTDPLARTFPEPYGSEINPGTSEIIGTSIDRQDYTSGAGDINQIYPMCLMDPSFRKAGVQSGFSTFVKPYVYKLATNAQLLPMRGFTTPSSGAAYTWNTNKIEPTIGGTQESYLVDPVLSEDNSSYVPDDLKGNVIFTNKLDRLGWMDTVTRTLLTGSKPLAVSPIPGPASSGTAIESGTGGNQTGGNFALQTYLPNIPMLYVMMPPAYKSLFYFRLIIKHYFEFGGFRSCLNVQSYGSASVYVAQPLNPVTSSNVSEIASMVSGIADGGPDSLEVENGEIVSSADGVL
ncbi:cap protein [Rat associated porprismacovirus 1]|uniref:Cap protein n=2 Tax=Porprismacovirus ratas1 TaxID=2845932 RepID=A0A0K1R7E3_9VIRU|nr:cap protein [Rat associated porprismacovirus 1]AKV57234.1 cap protein [Rat associated porprismacovirus 1]AKV57236.1 cap protein [Rat stool-associated circular ssDNA virus]AKV57238.1 cap protein [Rat stool-associated circular ssDNA virus]